MGQKTGYYINNSENRKLMRVGQKYKKDEEVSILDRIDSSLESVKDSIVGSGLGNLEIEEILNREVEKYGVKFERADSDQSNSERMSVALVEGFINTDLGIGIGYASWLHEFMNEAEDYEWKDFKNIAGGLVAHELVHRKQFGSMKRDLDDWEYEEILTKQALLAKDNGTEAYLANQFEISAFAKEAVREFLNVGYTKEKILDKMRRPFDDSINPGAAESSAYWNYVDFFEPGDPVMVRFLNYMYKHLGEIEKAFKIQSEVKEKPKNVLSAVGIVFDKRGHVLLGVSTLNDERKDKWVFPGGGVEKGETIYLAARREVEEEAGIRSKALPLAVIVDEDMPKVQFVVLKRTGGSIKMNSEFLDMDWFPLDELPKDILVHNKKMLTFVKNLIKRSVSDFGGLNIKKGVIENFI